MVYAELVVLLIHCRRSSFALRAYLRPAAFAFCRNTSRRCGLSRQPVQGFWLLSPPCNLTGQARREQQVAGRVPPGRLFVPAVPQLMQRAEVVDRESRPALGVTGSPKIAFEAARSVARHDGRFR